MDVMLHTHMNPGRNFIDFDFSFSTVDIAATFSAAFLILLHQLSRCSIESATNANMSSFTMH